AGISDWEGHGMSGHDAHPNVKKHPQLHRFWNPDAPLTTVPWPQHLCVNIDDDGAWWPMLSGSWNQQCPRCKGTHTVGGGAAMYCPWCGEPLDPIKARWIADDRDD